MVKRCWVVVLVLLSTATVRADDVDAQFRADVERVSTEAALAYDRGNVARDASRVDEAIAEYSKAIQLAPTVDHPRRRLCSVFALAGRISEAVPVCEAALERNQESPYNKIALAQVLGARNAANDMTRAGRLANEAAEAAPTSTSITEAWCDAMLRHDDIPAFRACTKRLQRLAPDSLSAYFFGAIVAASDGDYDVARSRLAKAKAAGLDDATYNNIMGRLGEVEEETATFPAWARQAGWIALWVVGIWIGLIVVLLAAGMALSRVTLRTVERATAADDAAGNEREQRLRRLYRFVLIASGVYFYLSVPVMLAMIVAAGAGVLLLIVAMGYIPLKLVVIVGLVVIGTVGAVLRSLFVRASTMPPGTAIDFTKHPKLRAMLDDVARTVGTKPVDVAYLTPGTDMAVTERTGVWGSVRGKDSQRSVIMGVGLFEGMTQLQLRSILAHEYGHFRNQDTAGGGFALAVRRSMYALILRMAASGVAGAFNPVWWFLRGFHRMYLGISQGASRLQEVLADRWAIQAYGSAAFIAGYKHVVVRSVEFDHSVDDTLKEVIDKRRGLTNLYTYTPAEQAVTPEERAKEVEEVMVREPTVFDSHPSPQQRLTWAQQLAVVRDAQPGDDAPVWELFEDRAEVERAMTAEVREKIEANHGITIGTEDSDPETDDGKWKGYGDDVKSA